MAEETQISWTDSTFNPVIGCMKVSLGCDLCYAEDMMDKRYHRVAWGQRKTESTEPSIGTRVRTSVQNWRQPHIWNRHFAAFQAAHGRRQRVFCASLADVFDNQWDQQWRTDLWKMIWDTPQLDWLLLTKRPENIEDMLPESWRSHANEWSHVWLGTTCENQEAYDKRWPILRAIPARVRFINYEPALERLVLGRNHKSLPDWLICGGESGRGHRPMSIGWAWDIKEECQAYEVPFFMKQMGGLKPKDVDIPAELMLRQFPRLT